MRFPTSPGRHLTLDIALPRVPRLLYKSALISGLRLRNRFSRRLVTGTAGVAVSMTSYGRRLGIVAHALESIAAGSIRPSRLILWVDEPDFDVSAYPMLQRLENRGLEILHCEKLGPHNKYFPYCRDFADQGLSLAVADDDIMYPHHWLEGLMNAAGQEQIPGYRAHRITTDSTSEGITPYNTWQPAPVDSISHANFMTGVGGMLLPPRFQTVLRDCGTSFMAVTPRADDIWLNALAIRNGYRRHVIGAAGQHLTIYPRSQEQALHNENVSEGKNDTQLAAVFGPDDIASVAADLANTP
ncbi:conserved hypothetical protein [Arthrobacter sp. 9V]|uniref:hypothetical protein n=1 Tax=Arthrobacter sp. 9V TaxID=2653132 RepID=UPI0012F24DB1|nr:hypothetical protein [Arthrobacter sp. 9V]VXC53973.1 conserved hypothetical protein [Arthrobacter sp. 9V]